MAHTRHHKVRYMYTMFPPLTCLWAHLQYTRVILTYKNYNWLRNKTTSTISPTTLVLLPSTSADCTLPVGQLFKQSAESEEKCIPHHQWNVCVYYVIHHRSNRVILQKGALDIICWWALVVVCLLWQQISSNLGHLFPRSTPGIA